MVNKVIIIGNLGRDVELRYTPQGMAVTTLSIATNRTYKGKDEQVVKETEWHRAVVWGAQAEACAKYLAKGRQVYVEGRLKTRSWDADGITRYATEIISERVQFLGNGGQKGPDKQTGFVPPEAAEEYIGTPPDGDDIPF